LVRLYHSPVTCRLYHRARDRSAAKQSSVTFISESVVSTEEQQHVALPKLYGAPAYARPPMPADEQARPFDPDDLPITAYQTDEERQLLEMLPARAWAPGGGFSLNVQDPSPTPNRHMNARPFRLRALAGKLFGGES
jgi:hypothetical protein